MDYFGDKEYVSNSMIGRLIEDPVLFNKWMNGEYEYQTTQPMILGSYVHHHWLDHISGGLLNCIESFDYPIVDDIGDLRSPKNRAKKAEIEQEHPNGCYIQRGELQLGIQMFETLVESALVKEYIQFHRDNYEIEVETIQTNEIAISAQDFPTQLIPIKGKMDIRYKDTNGIVRKMTDLKSTREMKGFRGSVWTYGYNRQAKHYTELEGLNLHDNIFDFLVISKDDMQIKVFETNGARFIRGAEEAFQHGMRQYVRWQKNDIINFNVEQL